MWLLFIWAYLDILHCSLADHDAPGRTDTRLAERSVWRQFRQSGWLRNLTDTDSSNMIGIQRCQSKIESTTASFMAYSPAWQLWVECQLHPKSFEIYIWFRHVSVSFRDETYAAERWEENPNRFMANCVEPVSMRTHVEASLPTTASEQDKLITYF